MSHWLLRRPAVSDRADRIARTAVWPSLHQTPELRPDGHRTRVINGKTTLLNCLSGLDDIDAGGVHVDGQDLFAMSDAEPLWER